MFGARFKLELYPWDFAAGRLFVEEAGGHVSTSRGESLPLAKTGIGASNGRMHEPIVDVVRSNLPLQPSGSPVAGE
jgi:myo-inositol-1(or 4)-monophosphatase